MFDNDHLPPAGDGDGMPYAQEPVRYEPEFTGRAGEFFGIWFVNLILSILTLGIYSAWAKVRTERYFYGNTRLAGAAFEYFASPIAILKGRLIAYAVVAVLVISSRFAPGLYMVLAALVGLAMPAIIVFGMRFRARYSAWRGVGFRFVEGPADAYGPFLGWPILSMLTLSALYPLAKRRQHEFVAEGHMYGGRRFRFQGQMGSYCKPYALALMTGIGAFVLLIVGMGAVAGFADGLDPAKAVVAILLPFYLGMFALGVYLKVRYTNLLWNNVSVDGHRFISSLRVRDLSWIYASNIVAIIVTLGLAVPWAMVRLARYRAARFSLLVSGDLDDFRAGAEQGRRAVGAELVEALDAGIDFGI